MIDAKVKVGRYEPHVWWWVVIEPDGYVITDGIRESWNDAMRAGTEAYQSISDAIDEMLT